MFECVEGRPFTGEQLAELKAFLQRHSLMYEEDVVCSVLLKDDDGSIAATGSLGKNTLKCFAVDERFQGQGVLAQVVTPLLQTALLLEKDKLFICTKPENRAMFEPFGFYVVLGTQDMLLMENRRGGFDAFLSGLQAESARASGKIGAIVANCNPFTKGHLYLVSTAAQACDWLHLFIVSEDASAFSAAARYEMACEGVKNLPNVIVHRTSDYIISAATFPTYFIKDKAKAGDASFELDLTLFGLRIATALDISVRFVGTEPLDPLTGAYNRAMKRILPKYHVAVEEIERLSAEGSAVSASRARELLSQGDIASVRALVPESTYRWLVAHAAGPSAENDR